MKTKTIWTAVGGAVAMVALWLVTAAAPNPAQGHFPAITIGGLTNVYTDLGAALLRNGVPVGGGGSSLWFATTPVANMDGTTNEGAYLTNSIESPIQVVAQNLTAFWTGPSAIVGIGLDMPDVQSLSVSNASIYSIGDVNMVGITSQNSSDIFAFGDADFYNARLVYAGEMFGIGDFNFYGVTNEATGFFTSSFDIYAIGTSNFRTAILTNRCFDIYSIGDSGFSGTYLDNCSDIFSMGNLNMVAGALTNVSHAVMLGSGSTVTNSNDFVFGNGAYNYFFPGGPINASGGYKASGLVGITADYTNEISGVITQRVTITQGIVTALTTLP